MKQIADAWCCTEKNPDVTFEAMKLVVVRYTDGTGNVLTPNDDFWFVPGVRFEDEPSGYIDPEFYSVHPAGADAMRRLRKAQGEL